MRGESTFAAPEISVICPLHTCREDGFHQGRIDLSQLEIERQAFLRIDRLLTLFHRAQAYALAKEPR